MSSSWKETRWFTWSCITEWQEFSVVIDETFETYSSNIVDTAVTLKCGGVLGSLERGNLFLWRFEDKTLEIVSKSSLDISSFQGIRLVFQTQPLCCPPVILMDYKSELEAEWFIYIANSSGIVSRIALTWRSGLFLDSHKIDKCFLSGGISVTHLNTLTTNVCLAIVGNPPAMVRIVFSDPSSSFQLLEIPETRESVAKRGLLGRVFRKKRFSEGSDSDFIVCSRVDRQGQFLLVVDSSGLFSLVDLTLLSCVAQAKYQKLAKKEYCEIFCNGTDRFLAILFVEDTLSLSPQLHLVDIFIERDSSFDNQNMINSLQLQSRFIYSAPIHIQVGCYMERDETFILEDEEGRIFLLPTSSSHLSHNESDPFYPAFDYYSEWHEYSGLGWAMDKVYDNNPIQMLFAPCRFSDDILAQVLKLPNYASRMNMYSYAASLSLSLDDYNRMVLSATRLSWEVESSWLIMDVDESDSVCLVIRQGSVNFLRRMEVFEGISLEQDDRNVSKLPASDSLYDISSIPKLFRQSNNLKLFSNSLLWNSLHWLFLQWIASLKAWKQRHDIQDTFQEDFALYYANYPSEHFSISLSLADAFIALCLKKKLYSTCFLEPCLKDNSILEENNSSLDSCILLSYLCKLFSPSPNIFLFLYDQKEWHTLLQVCELLKERYPIICHGVACWIYLNLQQVDLAESALTDLMVFLEGDVSCTETQVVKRITGIEREPLSFWLREGFFKFVDRLGYTERAIHIGKELLPLAKDDSSITSIRTFIFNSYMKRQEWNNALELLLTTTNGALSSWIDDFYLLIHSLAECRQLGLLYTQQLPPTLSYRIGEILLRRFQAQQATSHTLSSGVFVEYLLDVYRWYIFMKEFYLASRIALEGYCKLLENFDTIPGLPWLRTCNRLIGLICASLAMISPCMDQYLLLNGHLLEILCQHSGLDDWLCRKENQPSTNLKVKLEIFQFLGVVRGAQQWLLEHFPLNERNHCPSLKPVDLSSVKWLLTCLIQRKEWNLSFHIAHQGSYLLLSDRLLVLWFRIVGVYLMEQDCFEDSLWFQVMNFLVKAETLYAKFAPSFFYPGHFGIALLQGVLSRAPLEWCIPRWLLEFCGWGEYPGSQPYRQLDICKKKGNMSRLMQLLIEHERPKEAMEFMCCTLENKMKNEDILLTWTFVDVLLGLSMDDTFHKDIIKAQRRLKDLAMSCLKKRGAS